MEAIKKSVTEITSNPIGAIGGGVLAWWAIGKYGSVSTTWKVVGSIAGVMIGAMAQNAVKAKMSTPAATLKK